jgi:hypothetical protein
MATPKIPLNLFGIPFGLAGLGEAWAVLASEQHAHPPGRHGPE